MSIEGQGHFFTIYFQGFVCFVLYLAKISGERLQDHWSSGIEEEWFYTLKCMAIGQYPMCDMHFGIIKCVDCLSFLSEYVTF